MLLPDNILGRLASGPPFNRGLVRTAGRLGHRIGQPHEIGRPIPAKHMAQQQLRMMRRILHPAGRQKRRSLHPGFSYR
ncbi:hypothetical protein ABD76_17825 [Paenibacillus dendritiformis]|nr:hypothetical protein [Paenibacillus dendritiformis]